MLASPPVLQLGMSFQGQNPPSPWLQSQCLCLSFHVHSCTQSHCQLVASRSLCVGRGGGRMTLRPRGAAHNREGRRELLLFFHKPSLLMASACFPKFNHLFREKDWNLNRSQNHEEVHSRGTFPRTQGLIYKIYKKSSGMSIILGYHRCQDRT